MVHSLRILALAVAVAVVVPVEKLILMGETEEQALQTPQLIQEVSEVNFITVIQAVALTALTVLLELWELMEQMEPMVLRDRMWQVSGIPERPVLMEEMVQEAKVAAAVLVVAVNGVHSCYRHFKAQAPAAAVEAVVVKAAREVRVLPQEDRLMEYMLSTTVLMEISLTALFR